MKIRHLTESTELVKHIDEVLQSPFFDSFPSERFYRGTRGNTDDINRISFKYKGGPKDSYKFIHDYLNNLAEAKFNIPIRSLVYAYTNAPAVEEHGFAHIVIPIGRCEVYYHPSIRDLTEDLGSARDDIFKVILEKALGEMIDRGATDIFDEEVGEEVNRFIQGVAFKDINYRQGFKTLQDIKNTGVYKKEDIVDAIHDNLCNVMVAEFDEPSDDMDTFLDNSRKTLSKYIDKFYSKFDKYINEVEVAHNESDLNLSKSPELMLYMPDDFWLIPVEGTAMDSLTPEQRNKLLGVVK